MAGVPTSDTNVSKPTSLQDALKQSSSSHNSLMPSPLIHGGQKSQSGKLAKFNPEKDHIWHDRYFILDQVAGTLVYYDDPVDASSPPQDPKLSIKVADITKVYFADTETRHEWKVKNTKEACSFCVEWGAGKDRLYLEAADPAAAWEWTEWINYAKTMHKK